MSYINFLKQKSSIDPDTGMASIPQLNPMLHAHQADMVKWALKRGRAAIFADCGLGKGPMQMEWATRQPHDALIVAPLAVAHQFVREAEKFGIDLSYAKDQSQITKRITVTNYERLENFHIEQFGAVALDECFPAGTLIDCVIDGKLTKKHIEEVQIGDSIVNAVGVDRVSDIHRREVQYAVKVNVKERSFIASPNHPIFTQRGWVGAQDLRPGDYALESGEALSLVRSGVFSEIEGSESSEVLRDILLSEMADDSAGCNSEGSHEGSSRDDRQKEGCMASVRRSEGNEGNGQNNCIESDIKRRNESENIPHIESHEAQTFRTWWKRERNDGATGILDGVVAARMDSGICLVTGETKGRLSNLLQTRLSEQRNASVHRGGWVLARSEEGSGREENSRRGIFRVEGIEVLEQGNPELEGFRNAEGRIYFYDIGATRHPSFSVNGLLVHNSSILKNSSGAYSTWMIDAFKNTPFRLCSSATPAPNDVMELGTHAEFLGVMTRSEMLAMYFTHDGGNTSKWRVKGHAQAAFWSWMASWAVMIRKPSDLGYSDEGFTLPPLHMHEQCVSVTAPTSGFLFAVEAQTLQERQQARRDSIGDRVKACADIVFDSFKSERDLPWQELQKKTSNTCGNITQRTSTNGLEKLQSSAPNTTQPDEKNTQATQSCELNISSMQSNEIQRKSATTERELRTELETTNTNQCSFLRAGNALSAERNQQTQKAGVFISTTAIQQEPSEDCSALTATTQSGSSMTTLIYSEKQPHILRPWIVWCNLNSEQDALEDLFGDLAISIRGAMDVDAKEQGILDFINQKRPILITKPSVAGMGLNLQHCADMAYVGLSDSYEQLYQSIRRCWRFGQTKPVNVHIITAETEGAVVSNIKRKEREAEETYNNMIKHMKDLNAAALHGGTIRNKTEYAPSTPMVIPDFMRIAA